MIIKPNAREQAILDEMMVKLLRHENAELNARLSKIEKERDFYLAIMEEVNQAVRTTTDVTVWFPSLARLMEAADSAAGIKRGLEER